VPTPHPPTGPDLETGLDGGRGRIEALVVDGVFALVLAAVGIVGTAGAGAWHQTAAEAPVTSLAYGLAVVAALALAGRRIWPVATLAVVTFATSLYLVLRYPYGPILLSLLVAVYTVARYVPLRRALVAAAVALVVLMAHILVGQGVGPGLVGIVPGSAWVVVPFAVGIAVRLHRESVVRERNQLARTHADQERLRVAQEVHDVVGHGLSAITMQAEIALHLLDRQPEQAGPALSAISRTSREALEDLRVTLALVRRSDGDDARAPLPGLVRLDDLVARMSDSGVSVRVHTAGARRPLTSAVDLTAYRVVQESLTNVLRHAGAATALVRLGYLPGELMVEVTDTGRGGAADAPPGHGLSGMRERVTALGGSFDAGPGDSGGFRVHMRLPTP
jgi:signal transduction histidine kinase